MSSSPHPLVALACLALATTGGPSSGSPPQAEPNAERLYARVVDVGAGVCCIFDLPGDHYIVYDAGNYEAKGKAVAVAALTQLIPAGSTIDLLVLSHSDSDHLGAVPEICDKYEVQRVLRTGGPRDTQTWKDANEAVRKEREEGCEDMNLADRTVLPGSTMRFGDVFVTMVSGFHYLPTDWEIENESERQNAGSIVLRVEYAGRSILLCGDAVGRHIGDPANALEATEKFMVGMAPVIKLKSDAMLAPHHGADNASASAFLAAVQPTFVIFSAGHKYGHPRQAVAERYLSAGVSLANMFRTDFEDDERPKEEWSHGRKTGHVDPVGDDDVEIIIHANGSMETQYLQPH